jgi:hypothetical protein
MDEPVVRATFGPRVGHRILASWTTRRPRASAEAWPRPDPNRVVGAGPDSWRGGERQQPVRHPVVDFTDPANAREIAYADPAPLVHPTTPGAIVGGGDWSTHWLTGLIFESDMKRGLIIWNLSDSPVAGARKLDHLNPQTQETSFPLKRGN